MTDMQQSTQESYNAQPDIPMEHSVPELPSQFSPDPPRPETPPEMESILTMTGVAGMTPELANDLTTVNTLDAGHNPAYLTRQEAARIALERSGRYNHPFIFADIPGNAQ